MRPSSNAMFKFLFIGIVNWNCIGDALGNGMTMFTALLTSFSFGTWHPNKTYNLGILVKSFYTNTTFQIQYLALHGNFSFFRGHTSVPAFMIIGAVEQVKVISKSNILFHYFHIYWFIYFITSWCKENHRTLNNHLGYHNRWHVVDYERTVGIDYDRRLWKCKTVDSDHVCDSGADSDP